MHCIELVGRYEGIWSQCIATSVLLARLGPDGSKLYEDEKKKKSYGGASGFVQGGTTSWNDAGRSG